MEDSQAQSATIYIANQGEHQNLASLIIDNHIPTESQEETKAEPESPTDEGQGTGSQEEDDIVMLEEEEEKLYMESMEELVKAKKSTKTRNDFALIRVIG